MKYARPWAHAWKRAVRDAVVVPVEIAVELGELLDLLLAEDLAAIRTIRVVPQARAHPVVHADVEIRQHEHRRLQPVGEIEGRDREIEALLGFAGKISTCRVSPCEA